jgi:hypothetical protein
MNSGSDKMEPTKLSEQINNRVNYILMKHNATKVDNANEIPKTKTTTGKPYAGGDTGADTYGRRRSSKKRATQRKRKRRQRSASRRRAY